MGLYVITKLFTINNSQCVHDNDVCNLSMKSDTVTIGDATIWNVPRYHSIVKYVTMWYINQICWLLSTECQNITHVFITSSFFDNTRTWCHKVCSEKCLLLQCLFIVICTICVYHDYHEILYNDISSITVIVVSLVTVTAKCIGFKLGLKRIYQMFKFEFDS